MEIEAKLEETIKDGCQVIKEWSVGNKISKRLFGGNNILFIILFKFTSNNSPDY